MKLLSIVVPYYNGEEWLEKFISSLDTQTDNNFEVVFVSDGSTDGSGELINSFHQRPYRINSLELERNSGVSVARNFGIQKSNGDLISFADVDDILLPNFVESRRSVFERIDNMEVLMHKVARLEIDGSRKDDVFPISETTIGSVLLSGNEIINYIFDGKAAGYSVQFTFARTFVEKSDFDFPTDVHFMEDVVWLSKVLSNKLVHVEDVVDYLYVQRESSVTHQLNIDSAMNMESVLKVFSKQENMSRSLAGFLQRQMLLQLYLVAKYSWNYTLYRNLWMRFSVFRKRFPDVEVQFNTFLFQSRIIWLLAKIKAILNRG